MNKVLTNEELIKAYEDACDKQRYHNMAEGQRWFDEADERYEAGRQATEFHKEINLRGIKL